MPAVTELLVISERLRRLCRTRWSQDSITDHVTVKLPAPIFDTLEREVKHELSAIKASESGFDLGSVPTWFNFGGIRFERVDGIYWSVSAGGDPV